MVAEQKELAALLPNIATQAREALNNLRVAASQLVSAEAREQDPALDRRAALLDQSYYRLLRLVSNRCTCRTTIWWPWWGSSASGRPVWRRCWD